MDPVVGVPCRPDYLWLRIGLARGVGDQQQIRQAGYTRVSKIMQCSLLDSSHLIMLCKKRCPISFRVCKAPSVALVRCSLISERMLVGIFRGGGGGWLWTPWEITMMYGHSLRSNGVTLMIFTGQGRVSKATSDHFPLTL